MAKLKASDRPSPKPLADAAKRLKKLKDEKKKTEDRLTSINKDIVALETIELPKIMEDNDIDTVRIAGVGTISISDEVYSYVLKDDRPKLYEWMRDNGHGALITDWVFPQTLTAFVKSQLIDQAEAGVNDGNTLPDFVKVTQVPTAKLRSAR